MLTRIVLAYFCAFPLLIVITGSRTGGGHALVVQMASSVSGQFQVFFDTGRGFSEVESARLLTVASATPRDYRVEIPPGEYRHIRIDPGTAPGRYVIAGAAIVAGDGSTAATLPLTGFTPIHELKTIERTSARLDVEATPGATDPQVLYRPSQTLVVPRAPLVPPGMLLRLALAWAAGLVLVLIVEAGVRQWSDRWGWALHGLSGMARRRPRVAILAAALGATVLATYPLVFLGRSLVSPNNGDLPMLYGAVPAVPSADLEIEDTRSSDVGAMLWAFVPYSNVQRAAVREGEWPLWNRYNAAGRPLWGQGQTFLLDPLHWLTLVTPDPALGWDLKFIAHRFVFAAGIGLAGLAATGAWFPAALAAFAAPFVGVYAFRVNHPAVFAMSYAPWVLLAWFQLARSITRVDRARAVLLLVAALSLLLFASPPKEGIASALAGCAAGGVTMLMSRPAGRARWQKLAAGMLAGGLVLLVTTTHWLIFLDTWKLSATAYDVPYAQVGGVPDAVALWLGPLTPGPALPGLHLLALVLVLGALSAPRRLLRNRAVLGCALSAAACLVVAFGLIPVRWLLKTPFIGNIGHLHDVFITAAVPVLLVLAAQGASVLLGAGLARILLVTTIALSAAAWLVIGVIQMAPRGAFEPWAALFLLAAAAMLPGCLAGLAQARALQALAAGAAIGVLVLPGGLHAGTRLASLDRLLLQPRLRVALDANSPAVDAMHRAKTEPERAVGLDWALLAGTQALYEVEGIGGPDALGIARFDELVDAGAISRGGWLTKVGAMELQRMAPLLDLLNTRYLFLGPEYMPPGFVEVPLSAPDRLKVLRRDTAWPRAFFVDGIVRYSDPADLLRKTALEAKPIAAIQEGDSRAIVATRGLNDSTGAATRARDYKLTTNTTRFKVRSSGAGVVVLGEAFLPGEFVVTLNGLPVPYFRVNHVFKGIVVPSAGDWDVAFEYRPARWRTSLALTGLGTILCAVLAFHSRPRRPGVALPAQSQP